MPGVTVNASYTDVFRRMISGPDPKQPFKEWLEVDRRHGTAMHWRLTVRPTIGEPLIWSEECQGYCVAKSYFPPGAFPAWYEVPTQAEILALEAQFTNAVKENGRHLALLRSAPNQQLLWLEHEGHILLNHWLPTATYPASYGLPQLPLGVTEANAGHPLLAHAARDMANAVFFTKLGEVYHPLGGHMLQVVRPKRGPNYGLYGWLRRNPDTMARAFRQPLGHGWVWVTPTELRHLASRGNLNAATAHVVQHCGKTLLAAT